MRKECVQESSSHLVRLLSVAVATLLLGSAAMAEIDPNKIYLVLSTSKTTTLQKEIDEAAALGFRIVATASRGGGQVALMKRTASKGEDFGYRVIGTTKIDTMQKELNEAAAAGYCLLPGTMTRRERSFGLPELVAFVERGSELSRRCEYRVLGTSRTSKMEDELVAVEEEGFILVDIAQASELAAVLERAQ